MAKVSSKTLRKTPHRLIFPITAFLVKAESDG
jgi:hypothetical protein